jgi:hypothetical protein
VAIRAVLADVGEHRLGVAAGAGYFLVHAAEGVARGVMIEFGNGANRSPTCVGVAVFAGNVESAVRTSARLPLGIRGANASQGKYEEDEETTDLGYARNSCPLMLYEVQPSLRRV